MMVYEKITYSRTLSCHYIESFMLFKTFCPHIWGQNVVCIKCGSMLAETYTRIPDLYPAWQIIVEI
jgi:hypothetical protein